MKIEVIKLKYTNEYGDKCFSHKYIYPKYCCETLEYSNYITFTNEEIYPCTFCTKENRHNCENNCKLLNDEKDINLAFFYDDTYTEPWEDYYTTNTYYIPIYYCPFCGEKVEFEIIEEIDVTEQYLYANNKYKELHKKWIKCDSIKRKNELEKEWKTWGSKINNIISFGLYTEEDYMD